MFGTLLLAASLAFFSSTTTIQSNICSSPPASPTISSPASGNNTSSQEVVVTGTGPTDTAVNIFDNGQLAASTTADGSGNYGVDLQLTSGVNILIAQAENVCNQTANSTSVSVTFTPPPTPTPAPTPAAKSASRAVRSVSSVAVGSASAATTPVPSATTSTQSQSNGLTLVITNFGDQNTTTSPSVFIQGTTGIAANVEVVDNGKTVADLLSGGNGYFAVRVPLSVGDNNIEFAASAGTVTVTKTIHITRNTNSQKPPAKHGLSWILIIIAIILAILDLLFLVALTVYYKFIKKDNV